MTHQNIPRRPAILAPQQSEAIVGDTDPAEYSELAHACAWALMGLSDYHYPAEAPARVRTLIHNEGVDAVAELWSRSPEFTLPGALWRVYLFKQWVERDRESVEERFTRGLNKLNDTPLSALAVLPVDDHSHNTSEHQKISLDAVREKMRDLFAGEHREDTMEEVFASVAAAMLIIAAADGEASLWISDARDPLAYPVSTRTQALVKTAQELGKATRYAQRGELD